jgi:hypothetical protein
VTERQFHQLTNLSHLFPTSANVIVADLVEVALLVFPLDGLPFAVNNGIRGYNSVFRRVDFDYLELDLPHTAANGEQVALPNWPVRLAEIWSQEDIKERARQPLDGICDGEDGNPLRLQR